MLKVLHISYGMHHLLPIMLTDIEQLPDIYSSIPICDRIWELNHFVTFNTSNIYDQNNALHSTNQPYSEYRVSVYTELPETETFEIIGTYVRLW